MASGTDAEALDSETASSSTGRSGFSKVFRRVKPKPTQRSRRSSITPSVTSSDTAAVDGGSGLRVSLIDNALDRLRSHSSAEDRRTSVDSRRRRLSIRNSLHKRRSRGQDEVAVGDDAGGLLGLGDVNASEDSLALHRSESSSMITEDEEDMVQKPVRPSISPHQSHAGYLTLSSPLIASGSVVPADPSSAFPANINTPSASTTTTTDTLAPRHAKTLDVSSTTRTRSPSPVGKLKEAFAPTRKANASKPAGDDESTKSSGSGGGGLGGFFGGSGKKSDASSRRGSNTEERSEEQNTQEKGNTTPKRGVTPVRTVASAPATPPNAADAPSTLITPPTPPGVRHIPPSVQVSSAESDSSPGSVAPNPAQSDPSIVTSPSGNMISHRRVRSATNPPSKLSNSTVPPLTPTLEETRTPGGSFTSPTPGTGFFSSVFSAAQNAANNLSNSINTSISPGQRNRSGTIPIALEQDKDSRAGGEEVIGPALRNGASSENLSEKRQLAVETLGSGNLSLSHLGITETSAEPSPMASAISLPEQIGYNGRVEDGAAAQAVSAAYAGDKVAAAGQPGDRPKSLKSTNGATSPSRDDASVSGVQRSNSIRSRLSGGRRRRHRGSSATTSNTIATTLDRANTTLPNPVQPSAPRLTGFAVASSKRNRDFHQLFRSVPEDDYLIEDYSAALQRDILLQGRLYVSEGHICFSSNILGWVTNLVISFDEVVSVEKKSTAVIFPNAIVIQTLHARNVFASLVTRDATYDLLIGIWKISHPNLKSSLNGVTLDGAAGTGDKTEKAESIVSEEQSDEGSDEEIYDEDAEDEGASFEDAGDGSIGDSELGDKTLSRKASAAAVGAPIAGGSTRAVDNAEAVVAGATTSQDFPGPAQHPPTECGDEANHYEKLLTDTTILAPLGKIYSLMFGPASSTFMRKWLVDDQKSLDLQMEEDKQGLGENKKQMTYSYIKPLNGSIGPKQTKCIITLTLEQFDLDKAVTVVCSTQTPDVPNGNIFVVKTRYCLMWGPNNSTRMIMSCTIEWSGKSWLKGPIEKGANDGQTQYAKDIVGALRAAVVPKPVTNGKGRSGKGGKSRRLKEERDEKVPDAVPEPSKQAQADASWGVLQPLKQVVDLLGGVQGCAIAILAIMVLWLWLTRSSGNAMTVGGPPGIPSAQRIAAYEELWAREEGELWRWLEDRVGGEGGVNLVGHPAGVVGGRPEKGWTTRRRLRGLRERLRNGEMGEREVDEAIRVTGERLEVLKEAVERGKREKERARGKERKEKEKEKEKEKKDL